MKSGLIVRWLDGSIFGMAVWLGLSLIIGHWSLVKGANDQ